MTNETKTTQETIADKPAVFQTREDLKNALLLVSITINLFLFTAWLVVQTDPRLALVILNG